MGALIDEIKNGTIMKKIKAIIEKANDGGISIYSEDVNGAYGFGLTEQEAKNDFLSVLEEQAEYYKEKHGEFPVWYKSVYSEKQKAIIQEGHNNILKRMEAVRF